MKKIYPLILVFVIHYYSVQAQCPTAPTGPGSVTLCYFGATIADINVFVTGTSVQWYNSPTGGSPLSLSTPLISQSPYFASQTVNGCESSDRLLVVPTVATPMAPTGNSSQNFCEGATIANLSATGTAIKWYSTPSGGVPLSASTLLVDNTHYYASQTNTSCESSLRLDVTVSITSTTGPSGNATQTLCPSAKVTNLSATGIAINWYSTATGGAPLLSSTSLTNGTHYYASQTINGCESLSRLDVIVSITSTASPTGNASQTFCPGAIISNLSATGTAIKWYSTATGGSPLSSTTVLANGTHYYASQTLNGCESVSRLDVTVSITNNSSPTGNATQTFCSGAKVTNLSATGTAIKWYSTATGGSPLLSTTALANGIHYYASQTISGCESLSRLDVTVSITNTPSPTGNATQTFCAGATVADLSVTGVAIKWYNKPTNGSQLSSSLDDGIHYYASQTVNGCESTSRLDVTASVITTPRPTGVTPQIFCSGAHVSDLVVSGTNVKWYNDWTTSRTLYSGTEILGSTLDGHHYFATQTVNGCESAPFEPDVQIGLNQEPAPTFPFATTWKTVSLGDRNGIALKTDNTLWTWGKNDSGQLGDGTTTTTESVTPVQIGIGIDWDVVQAAGSRNFAIKKNGTLWAWGNNQYGRLGDGTTTNWNVPTQVGSASNWKSISVSPGHVMALRTDGTLWTWGDNQKGQLGIGSNTNQPTPIQVGTDTDWVAISAGLFHSLALKANGTLWAWGEDLYYELGDGDATQTNKNIPIHIGTDTDWQSVHADFAVSFAIKTDGTLWGWGDNTWGELGNGVSGDRAVPTKIGSDNQWATIAPTGGDRFHTIAIKKDGTLWGWGYNKYGQLGNGADADSYTWTAFQIDADQWASVAVGDQLSYAIKKDGTLWLWGKYDYAQEVDYYTVPTYTNPASHIAIQQFCPGASVSDLVAIGSSIQWYSSPTGGTPLAPSTPLQNATHYYASQQANYCESINRLHAAALVNSIQTPAPTGSSTQTFCPGTTVASLLATGTAIKWYSTATGGSSLVSSTSLVNGTHYYASQTINGCESASRLDVTVSLTNTASPTGNTSQIFCSGATVASLSATGTAIKWYSAATGGSPLSSTTLLVNGTHYYASQTANGCESSSRLNVTTSITNTASPSGSTSQTFCFAATVTSLSATGTAIKWYSTATGGSPLSSATSLVNGAHYYASQTIGACESVNRLNVTVSIGVSAPTGPNSIALCNLGGTVADMNTFITGTSLNWYNTPTGGAPLPPSWPLMDNSPYFASQTISGCESTDRLFVIPTVGSPTAPSGNSSQNFCTAATVANLSAFGTAIKWYSTATGGSTLLSSTSLVNGAHYYASQTVTNCESISRLDVTASLANTASPTGNASQTFCSGATVASLSATGTAIKWYGNATGGSPLASTTALVNGTHYYASQTISSCASALRLDVTASITNTASPTGNASQAFCSGATVASLSATGTAIKWYSTATGGSSLLSSTSLVDGTHYYASQTVNSCESPSRLDVTLAITNTASPTGNAAQTFCSGATVSNLSATGTAIKWYSTATGGSSLLSSTSLVDGTHYYASQTINSCESPSRLDVTASITNTASPSGIAAQTFCSGATVASLSATGTAIKWYGTATGGSPLSSSTSLVNATHYYASQTTNGCESASRLDVTVSITNTTSPTGSGTQTFCSGVTIANLSATGTAIKWYSTATGGLPLSSTTALVNATHYYASQTINGCESSSRLDVTVSVTSCSSKLQQQISFPAPGTKSFGDASFDLTATASSGLPVTYSSSNNLVITVSSNRATIVGVGKAIITASQPGNLTYDPAADVSQTVTVNKRSQTITFDPLASMTVGDPNFELTATASSSLPVTYVSSNSAVAVVLGNVVTIVGAGSASITAAQKGNANYAAASSVTRALTVKKNQIISFGTLPSKKYGDKGFNLSAKTDSGLPVTYTSSNLEVAAILGNLVRIIGAGTASITANQVGDNTYNAAPTVTQTLVIEKADQQITFNALSPKGLGDLPFTLQAGSSSSLPIRYTSSNLDVASVSGNSATVVGKGMTTFTAYQDGDTNYNPAVPIARTLRVKLGQIITFNTLPEMSLNNSPFSLTATASSGLPVTFTSSDSTIAAISGTHVTLKKTGTVQIKASQPGDSTFNAAPPVSQPMTIVLNSSLVTSIEEQATEEFWLSPNPAKEKIKLQLGSKPGMKQITITEINGSIVYQQSTGLNEFELDITAYHPGLYLVTISNLKEIRTLKLVIL